LADIRQELLWRRRILLGAIYEQKVLAETVPHYGIDPNPYQENISRLKVRLVEVIKEIEDYGLD
jgi:hypothetical protein